MWWPGIRTPNKPTSLELTKFQQAKPEKESNLPLSPSLEDWLPVQAQTLEGKDTDMHEGTGGAPITGTSFGPITQENSREAIKILGGLVRNRCRPLGHAHRTMGVQDPLCNAAPTEISGTGDHYPKWSLSGRLWTSQFKSCRTRERSSQLHSPQAFTAACSSSPRQQGSGGRS